MSTTPMPDFPGLTPSVQRACSTVVQNAHLSIAGLVIDVLQTALIDENDPDWLARTLYVVNNHDMPAAHSLQVWNALSGNSSVKVHYRMVADGLRILITGQPV